MLHELNEEFLVLLLGPPQGFGHFIAKSYVIHVALPALLAWSVLFQENFVHFVSNYFPAVNVILLFEYP